jgi:hypothetical protein
MDRREQLQELHLALEGAVDQLTRAQRLAVSEQTQAIDKVFTEVVAIRNAVREELMKELAKGPKKLPTI